MAEVSVLSYNGHVNYQQQIKKNDTDAHPT